ncbi:hypothetical protein Naga_100470g1 [Nannochloropsis gaditana]|uniref:Uncharacterized protein n=1 Tax=Nannochloropsis gaditana TaxID=72520 RepID=W7TH13_9STRA|nr:hypothetical protein Naga_100470g1 [Nannochloropsis gaditana]
MLHRAFSCATTPFVRDEYSLHKKEDDRRYKNHIKSYRPLGYSLLVIVLITVLLASLRLQKKEFDLQSHHMDDPTLDFSKATLEKNDLKFSKCFAQVLNTEVSNDMQDKDILPMVKCFIENGELEKARLLVDTTSDQSFPRAEPAYYLCKAFREKENYALAYYYYLLASKMSTSKPAGRLPGEEAVHDYLLEYEKSIIWYYVGALSDRSTRRHGLSLCMNLLENPLLPSNLASIVYNNIPVYTQSLRGHRTLLRAEKNENDPWRFSTPTFLDSHVLLREVNYFAAEDGSYHVSQDSQVKTRVLVDGSDQYIKIQESEDFRKRITERGWHHPEAYVQGLEDTRFKSTFDCKANSSNPIHGL